VCLVRGRKRRERGGEGGKPVDDQNFGVRVLKVGIRRGKRRMFQKISYGRTFDYRMFSQRRTPKTRDNIPGGLKL